MAIGQHKVLCVDDETSILKSLMRLLRKEDYRLLTATSVAEAISIMNEETISLVISDQRMPGESGIEFLSIVREKHPDTIRILLSGYSDIATITESVNKGNIYKLIFKPWNDQNLILEIRQALEQYDLIQTNNALHKTIMEQNEELKVINENLESLVNERTKDLEIQNKMLELSRTMLEEIPLPIIGVGEDMMIVYKNKEASDLVNKINIFIGDSISEHFPEELEEKIKTALASNKIINVDKCTLYKKKYKIKIKAIAKNFEGKGVVMTLEECF